MIFPLRIFGVLCLKLSSRTKWMVFHQIVKFIVISGDIYTWHKLWSESMDTNKRDLKGVGTADRPLIWPQNSNKMSKGKWGGWQRQRWGWQREEGESRMSLSGGKGHVRKGREDGEMSRAVKESEEGCWGSNYKGKKDKKLRSKLFLLNNKFP